MSKRLQHIIFFIILLFLSWVGINTSHGDEEEVEYKSGNKNETTGLFSILSSDVVRVWRNVRYPQCWRFNPDDPKGEILKGVHYPIRLKVIDKDNPIRKCVGVLIGKHRAGDGDLTFDVLPNQECRYLTNESHVKERKGGLHCEIVPDDRAKLDRIFDHMRLKSVVEGVWVEDTTHENWRELHPVTSLRVLRKKD